MKKVILSILAVVVIGLTANAQVEPYAIGLRFGGGNFGGGSEINYLHGIGDANRAEIGVGFNSFDGASYMSLAGVYQWVFEFEEGFSWFVGPGAQLFLISNASAILLGGEVGVDYNFNTKLDIPLQVGLDTRPMFNLGDGNGFGWGVTLKVHYTF